MNIPHSILKRKVCKNKNKKCNHLKSYSDYELVNNTDNTKTGGLTRPLKWSHKAFLKWSHKLFIRPF